MLIRAAALFILAASLIPPPAYAAEKEPKGVPDRIIEVSGNGEAHATPDLAFLNLAIETRAATAEQTASRNAASSIFPVPNVFTSTASGSGTPIAYATRTSAFFASPAATIVLATQRAA